MCMALLYKGITERIIEACYEVANELGAGFLESVYEKALLVALGEKEDDEEGVEHQGAVDYERR